MCTDISLWNLQSEIRYEKVRVGHQKTGKKRKKGRI